MTDELSYSILSFYLKMSTLLEKQFSPMMHNTNLTKINLKFDYRFEFLRGSSFHFKMST